MASYLTLFPGSYKKEKHSQTILLLTNINMGNFNEWMSFWISYILHISPSLMAVYNSMGWDRTSACEGASGSCYQYILELTHPPTHPHNPSTSVKGRRPNHNTRNYIPYSCEQCVGSLTSHKVIMNKACEMGPTIYRPYPRRLESLTIMICRCHSKGKTFS